MEKKFNNWHSPFTMSKSPTEEITYENFSRICRCCVINNGEMDVFEAHIEESPLSTILSTCTNEMINKTDGLPRAVCDACVQLLINFHVFIKTFKEAQENIKYMYQVLRNKTDERRNSSDQIEINRNPSEQFVTKDTNVVDVEEISNNVMNEGRAPQVSEGILFEIDKSTDEIQISQNIELVDIVTVVTSDEEDKISGNKKFQNLQRIEVDPQLRSGLDLQCFQCLDIFSSKAETARHYKSTGHTMAPNYKCGICFKAINKRKAYWDHMAMHRHLKKKAVCEVCGAVVVSLHLKRHMLVHQEKSHVCQYCGKGYVQKNTLTDHVRRKHEGKTKDMNSLCFICGKLCTDLKSLTSHLNTHTDEKWKKLSHHCQECGKHFLNAQSLNTHIYMAHKIKERIPKQRYKTQNMLENNSKKSKKDKTLVKKNGVKREPRECPVCHKVICFLGFSRHLTTHTGIKPHQCKYCPKKFRLFSSLKSHMYVHLNLKPFKCDVCCRQFRHYTTLKVHKRVHTGEKPYVCCTCTKGFPSASGLKRHQNQRQHPMPILDVEE